MVNDAHLTYYQRNKELILANAKQYYKNKTSKRSKRKISQLNKQKKNITAYLKKKRKKN